MHVAKLDVTLDRRQTTDDRRRLYTLGEEFGTWNLELPSSVVRRLSSVWPSGLVWGESVMVGLSSRSMKTRSEAAMAACMMLYFSARSRIGWKARSVYWKKATSTPRETVPCSTAPEPYHMRRAVANIER